MKQRRTYLVNDPDSFTPEQIEVKDGSLLLKSLKAVQEHRITFSFSELSLDLQRTFGQWQELHIKWASPKTYTAIPPFTSRVSSGLHVFFEHHEEPSQGQLCDTIHEYFDPAAKCSSTSDARDGATPLIRSNEGNDDQDVSLQYYSYLPNLENLVSKIQEKFCPRSSAECKRYAESLSEVSYFDIDYSTQSSTLILTAFFDAPPQGWTSRILAPTQGHTVEVGVLTREPNPDPEDIAFGGFLTVLGRDATPKPTRFQTPTRHYPLSPASSVQIPDQNQIQSQAFSYKSSFASPTGLHPTLELRFSSTPAPPADSCTLHAHLTLPSYLFIDKYQFTDPLALAAHNLVALTNITGATDLEAPDWVVTEWGSSALFELAFPESDTDKPVEPRNPIREWEWTSRIPMHLRYLPATAASHTAVPVPWPVVFWACTAEQDGRGNPFDRRNLGYDAAFVADTRFIHVPPQEGGNGTGQLVSWVDVPVLDTRAAGWVEMGTIGVVVCAFLGLCVILFGGKTKKDGKSEKKVQ